MTTIASNLQYLKDTKDKIKEAIVAKGTAVASTDTFRSYADKIKAFLVKCFTKNQKFQTNLETMWEYLHNTEYDNLYQVFYKNTDIAGIDVTNMCTSKVTNCQDVFWNCTNLKEIRGLDTWDTSKVTNMQGTFQGCSSLTSVDVSNWDTSKVTNMQGTFSGCSSLTSISGLENWDTSNVTNMYQTFSGCSSLTSVDVSNWDTSKVTYMQQMFLNCSVLAEIKGIEDWDVSKNTSFLGMFHNCYKMNNLDLSKWDTSSATTLAQLVYSCRDNMTKLNISGWNTAKVKEVNSMMSGVYALEWLDMSNWTDCSNITSGNAFPGWGSGKVTTFIGDHTLEEVEAGTVTVMKGLKISCDIHYCTSVNRASILALLKGVADVTSESGTHTITMGSTLLAKLTDDDKKIATDKGWTLA